MCGWTSHIVQAIVRPGLCAPFILGLLFLSHNCIVVDAELRTVVQKDNKINLFTPVPCQPIIWKLQKDLEDIAKIVVKDYELVVKDIHAIREEQCAHCNFIASKVKLFDSVGAVRKQIEVLLAQEQLAMCAIAVVDEYKDVFEEVGTTPG